MNISAESERWLTLAKEALEQYGMADAAIEWLAQTHNAVFLVQRGENKYVLRMSRHSDNLWERIRGELMCLTAIKQASGLMVPQVVDLPEDLPVSAGWQFLGGILSLETSEMRVHCVLFHYIIGEERLPDHLTSTDTKRIGAFLARLHGISEATKALAFRPRLDYAGLYGENSVYYPGKSGALFTAEQRQVMQDVQAQVKAAMDEIGVDAENFGLIHGDFLLNNILFHEGDVRALDFEYCGAGYYLYDLAPLLWQLKVEARYDALADALWDGYTAIRSLPRRALLETFIAGRQVASMRWIVLNQHLPFIAGKAPQILEHRANELRAFLNTGTLNRTKL